jgi:type VI secretion system protein ImpK
MSAGAVATFVASPPQGLRLHHGGGAPDFAGSTHLLEAFHAFYAEVARQRQLITHAPGGLTPGADTVRQRLLNVLEAQAVAFSRKLAEHELKAYEEAQYVMAAMADEVLLAIPGGALIGWADRPLEACLFSTHDAGERVFRKIDEILTGESRASTALLLVYMAALALGFQGKYRALGMPDKPEEDRRKLAQHLLMTAPAPIATGSTGDELCAEAHAHTRGGGKRSHLQPLRNGYLPFAIVTLCLLLIGQLLWSYRVSDVADGLDAIEGAS